MAFHPVDSTTFYAGAPAGGVWKSTDNGDNWTPLSDGLPSIGVSEIIVHPTDPSTIFILTGDGDGGDTPCIGVLKSEDGGETWSETAFTQSIEQTVNGFRMVMHPDSSDVMLVAMVDGIYRTNDGFDSVTKVLDSVMVFDF